MEPGAASVPEHVSPADDAGAHRARPDEHEGDVAHQSEKPSEYLHADTPC